MTIKINSLDRNMNSRPSILYKRMAEFFKLHDRSKVDTKKTKDTDFIIEYVLIF